MSNCIEITVKIGTSDDPDETLRDVLRNLANACTWLADSNEMVADAEQKAEETHRSR